MRLTVNHLHAITGQTGHHARKQAFCKFWNYTAPPSAQRPHDLAQMLAQVCHESGGFRHVKEIWGPTAAQRRYEGRTDLGNVQPGDGERFQGRDILQVTGRANYRALTAWAKGALPGGAPDFEADPAALEKLEFLGLGTLWYWQQRVPKKYVEAGDIEMVTRRVNGGLNGYDDRLRYYTRAALVLLGYGPKDVRQFQQAAGLAVDGIAGPRTRARLHTALVALEPVKADTPNRWPGSAPDPTDTATDDALGGLVRFFAKLFKGGRA